MIFISISFFYLCLEFVLHICGLWKIISAQAKNGDFGSQAAIEKFLQ